ncbi:hypothetical protein KSC_047150 [Ktedonobacter sp. SOSP1-52]|nr:hypothetical protein KSC_047150 [Ktedonobacter sp. SOSP1-52]
MQGKTRLARVHLVACLSTPSPLWISRQRLPTPSPTPILFLPRRKKYMPRRIHLVRVRQRLK